MSFTAAEIAQLTNGTLEGDVAEVGERPDRIEDARTGSITFFHHPKYREYVLALEGGIILVRQDFSEKVNKDVTIVRVEDPLVAFAKVLAAFEVPVRGNVISKLAVVASNVKLGERVSIGDLAFVGALSGIGSGTRVYPQVYIGRNVHVGEHCIIYPGAKIYDNCLVGDRCIIHAGAVIGADGFGFAPQKDGSFAKIPQLGNVVLEKDVEIGANTTIDRAVTGSTLIRKGVKIDNLVMVGHNAEIGEHTVIAAQTGISGSTRLGDHCQVGGQVGFSGHLVIAPGSRINAQSGVAKNIEEPGKAWSGSPAREFTKHYRMLSAMERLPDIDREIAAIKEILSLLNSKQ
jgi:UDP-3-O-[3-hydroxymyristoyl] glucosamine N-acyltransferase